MFVRFCVCQFLCVFLSIRISEQLLFNGHLMTILSRLQENAAKEDSVEGMEMGGDEEEKENDESNVAEKRRKVLDAENRKKNRRASEIADEVSSI